ncbi:TonB-dependent receptor plug domain-containing protein [Leptospira stimsonii]|uniref:TonB-dependent receptor n=1 Tax=Leptospira stimsonii TaxID=2202203 RepID=A0ABY2N0V8_9LEPT|nr:TonB-dependent receptor plug domain-containing protein [Leptospira stimsonii]TGK19694.1 TonB-dependent receptor [Leptospira stimsonii]TGM13693.1 TonB-dependent receptor [Leptospira stimsonii]
MSNVHDPSRGLQRKLIYIFSIIVSLTWAQTLIAKTALRISVNTDSHSDPPSEVWIRGKGLSKVYSFAEKNELTVDISEFGKGAYEVILTLKSGSMEQKYVNIDSDIQNLEFIIRPKRGSGINVIGKRQDTIPSYVMSQEDAVRMPGGFGDAVKAVQSMPGVIPLFQTYTGSSFQSAIQTLNQTAGQTKSPDKPNGESGFLVMRGAGSRANQFYFNGFPMSYPFHADGLTSAINNNAIRSLELYSGSYSARYGFATGGIINIEGYNKRSSNLTVGHINAFLTDVYAYRNITKDLNVSVSGKKYYPNVVLGMVPNLIPTETFLSEYQDYQARIGWDISEKHSISFQSFGAKDRRYPFKEYSEYNPKKVVQSIAKPPSALDAARLNRTFRTDAFQYEWKPVRKIKNTLNISRNYFQELTENGSDLLNLNFKKIGYPPSLYQRLNTIENEYSNNLTQIENVTELEPFTNNWKVLLGGQYRETEAGFKGKITQYNFDPDVAFTQKATLGSPEALGVLRGDSVRTRQIGYFFENRFRLRETSLNLGVRRDYYDKSGEWKTSPRISVSQEIPYTQSRFFAGYGRHFQAPSDVSRYSSRTGNPNLKMEESDHAEVGWDQKIGGLWNFKIEGYSNTFSNLSVADPYIKDPYSSNRDLVVQTLDPNANASLLQAQNLNFSNSMTGYSRGVEIFVKKEATTESGFYGWLSYTKSITKRNRNLPDLSQQEYSTWLAKSSSKDLVFQENDPNYYANFYRDGTADILFKNSKEELYDFDRTHVLNMVLGWKFSDKAQLGLKFTYMTNFAYTPIVGSNSLKLHDQLAALFPELQSTPAPPGNDSFSTRVYEPVYSNYNRSARLPQYKQFDLRFDRFIYTDWGKITAYFELVNITGSRIATGEGSMVPLFPYAPNANPQMQYMYLNGQPSLKTDKTKIPYLNFGIEFRF